MFVGEKGTGEVHPPRVPTFLGVQAELKIQIPIPLNHWLQQTVTHPVSGKDMEIGDLSGDFLERGERHWSPESAPPSLDCWRIKA